VALSVRTGTVDDLKDGLRLYETATKQWVEPGVKVPADEEVQSLVFSPDGKWQLTYSLGPGVQRALRMYHAADMRQCFSVKSDGYGLSPTAYSDDGKLLVRPEPPERNKPFCFVVVDAETGAVRSTLHIKPELLAFGEFHRIAFTADGKWVYSNQDDRVLVWDVATGQIVTYWVWTGTGAVAAIGSTADSRFIRALMQEGSIASFDVSVAPQKAAVNRLDVPTVDPKAPRMVPFYKPWSFNRAAFSSDGMSVLRDSGGKIDVYDLPAGKLSREFTLPANAAGVQFSAAQADLVPVHMKDNSIAVVRIPR
jgi:WD40 repeat protein